MITDVKSLHADWSYPTRIRFGSGRIRELPNVCKELKMKNPLIVTDSGLASLDIFEGLCRILKVADVDYKIFPDIKPNPVLENVSNGRHVFAECKCDGIVAFGGGSSMDVGKAIAFLSAQNGSASNWLIGSFEEVEDVLAKARSDIPPVISIPTTSGTGAEVGRSSSIIDEKNEIKKGFFHPKMLPQVCIADPELTLDLPAEATAAFGMDALSHNLEAYCSKGFHPIADGCGMMGVKMIADWLPKAVQNGKDIVARSYVMAGSIAGGTAFQKGVGATHALGHPLSSVFDIHHGLAMGVLLPYVVAFNASVRHKELTELSRYLGLKNPSPKAVVNWLIQLRTKINIPNTLSELDIKERDLDKLANLASKDVVVSENPVPVGLKELRSLLQTAFSGQLSFN